MPHPAEDRSDGSSISSGDEQDGDMVKTEHGHQGGDESKGDAKKSTSSAKNKDPSRPKRKKARRACFACQRAHLTCGDERPCQRCVKRGLTDSCQDGARKKAKYLHDTPAEALIPGNIASFPHLTNGIKQTPNTVRNRSLTDASITSVQTPSYPQQAPFNPTFQQPQRQMSDSAGFQRFNSTQSPSSQYNGPQASPISAVTNAGQPFGPQSFHDHNDTNMFNFDIASMNFGNHYGAMEFGMLGHMASGANETSMLAQPRPPSSSAGGFDDFNATFGDSKAEYALSNPDTTWPPTQPQPQPQQQQQSVGIQQFPPFLSGDDRRNSHAGPHAFAIGAGPGSLSGASPQSNEADIIYDQHGNIVQSSPQVYNPMNHLMQNQQAGRARSRKQQAPQQAPPPPPAHSQPPSGDRGAQPSESISKRLIDINSILPSANKTRRNTSSIYSSINKPYPYTSAFHALTAVLKRRFPTQKRLRIAQALATVRPSFISCTRTLVDEDLIFMEKCFQRGLWDYDDFQHDVCTPTIVCRRTGEVAHVTKEFCIMSGWNRDVLLGRKPNRNANTNVFDSSSNSTRGVNTPSDRKGANGTEGGEENPRPQPVFLAELLDEDSVVQFYEDYAKLAFADHKGSVSSRCQVIKYMTKDEVAARKLKPDDGDHTDLSKRGGISSENAMRNLGSKEGRVGCVFCWEVKRDVFNIPMMIVLNFLPIT